jgi:hypothetical protein
LTGGGKNGHAEPAFSQRQCAAERHLRTSTVDGQAIGNHHDMFEHYD